MRRRMMALGCMVRATAMGLVWRLGPLHLPWVLFKYGGSMLWAVALYWLVVMLLPRVRVWGVAVVAGLIALAVELSRLWHTPGWLRLSGV